MHGLFFRLLAIQIAISDAYTRSLQRGFIGTDVSHFYKGVD